MESLHPKDDTLSLSLKIVIFCNKKDFFLTKILIASIRYYYPEIEIYILKDYLNGFFNTSEVERFFSIKIMDLGIKKYGWAAAKVHFLISKKFEFGKFLLLDSDIVFIGKFLEELYEKSIASDVAVSTHASDDPYSDFVKETYYSYDFLKKYDPFFKFPGYFFNTGQMIVKSNIIKPNEIIDFFDLSHFPYWKSLDVLPLVDQSLLNFILPLKEQKGELKIYKGNFMIWSESQEAQKFELDKIKKGIGYPFLIHWAGAVRVPMLNKMTRFDILNFFEEFYYEHIPYGNIKSRLTKILPSINYTIRKMYRNIIKPLISRK